MWWVFIIVVLIAAISIYFISKHQNPNQNVVVVENFGWDVDGDGTIDVTTMSEIGYGQGAQIEWSCTADDFDTSNLPKCGESNIQQISRKNNVNCVIPSGSSVSVSDGATTWNINSNFSATSRTPLSPCQENCTDNDYSCGTDGKIQLNNSCNDNEGLNGKDCCSTHSDSYTKKVHDEKLYVKKNGIYEECDPSNHNGIDAYRMVPKYRHKVLSGDVCQQNYRPSGQCGTRILDCNLGPIRNSINNINLLNNNNLTYNEGITCNDTDQAKIEENVSPQNCKIDDNTSVYSWEIKPKETSTNTITAIKNDGCLSSQNDYFKIEGVESIPNNSTNLKYYGNNIDEKFCLKECEEDNNCKFINFDPQTKSCTKNRRDNTLLKRLKQTTGKNSFIKKTTSSNNYIKKQQLTPENERNKIDIGNYNAETCQNICDAIDECKGITIKNIMSNVDIPVGGGFGNQTINVPSFSENCELIQLQNGQGVDLKQDSDANTYIKSSSLGFFNQPIPPPPVCEASDITIDVNSISCSGSNATATFTKDPSNCKINGSLDVSANGMDWTINNNSNDATSTKCKTGKWTHFENQYLPTDKRFNLNPNDNWEQIKNAVPYRGTLDECQNMCQQNDNCHHIVRLKSRDDSKESDCFFKGNTSASFPDDNGIIHYQPSTFYKGWCFGKGDDCELPAPSCEASDITIDEKTISCSGSNATATFTKEPSNCEINGSLDVSANGMNWTITNDGDATSTKCKTGAWTHFENQYLSTTKGFNLDPNNNWKRTNYYVAPYPGTLDECQNMCQQNDNCHHIVRSKSSTDDDSNCWFKGNTSAIFHNDNGIIHYQPSTSYKGWCFGDDCELPAPPAPKYVIRYKSKKNNIGYLYIKKRSEKDEYVKTTRCKSDAALFDEPSTDINNRDLVSEGMKLELHNDNPYFRKLIWVSVNISSKRKWSTVCWDKITNENNRVKLFDPFDPSKSADRNCDGAWCFRMRRNNSHKGHNENISIEKCDGGEEMHFWHFVPENESLDVNAKGDTMCN